MTDVFLEGVATLDDLLHRLGEVPACRVRFRPLPGTATEDDVLAVERRENLLCELVDGVLVEKAMGYRESLLAAALIHLLRAFVLPRNLGLVSGADGMMRLGPGLVRIPDVAFVSWEHLPHRRVPIEAIPALAPDLAVEVLSPGNSAAEMLRQRHEYFAAGVRLVWSVDPDSRTVEVYKSPEACDRLTENETLDGGAVLPGFSLSVKDLFAEMDRHGA